MVQKALLPVLLCLLLLCGCQETAPAGQTAEYDGKTSVLLEDAVLTKCYSGQTDGDNQITWVDLSQTVDLKKGDIVLALKESGDTTQVNVPTGDTPWSLYGEIPSKALSQKNEDIEQGNLAIATDKMAYANINGEEGEQMIGTVKILVREGDWCQIQPFAGGDSRTFWIPTSDLSFDLDSKILARAS